MNGMDLYLNKFDGLAATTEDFLNSILEELKIIRIYLEGKTKDD